MMWPMFNLKNKIILLFLFFTFATFALHQYWHNYSVNQTILEAESARNALLLQTMVPVVQTNLAFGLIDSNREYLDAIAKDNSGILSIVLQDRNEALLYHYGNQNQIKYGVDVHAHTLSISIIDRVSEAPLGSLEVRFSNLFFEQLRKKHTHFTLQYFASIGVMLSLIFFLLGKSLEPMQRLVNTIRSFSPLDGAKQLSHTLREDETGIIQNALADMTDRISEHSRMLEMMNQTLEQKVHERTLALEAKIFEVQEQEKMLIAQSRLAAMGEMMSMVAHQWRQPLSTSTLLIANYKLKAMLSGKATESYDEILDTISDTMTYLSDTIDDFQTYFKPDKEMKECSIDEVVGRAVQFTAARMKNAGVEIVYLCVEGVQVKSYFNELVQIIMNIINNAVDAILLHPQGPKKINIACGRQDDGRVKIEICDSGGGIDEAIIDQIFEPYFSTKGKNGTGLGLYMAKMIVERHLGGRIDAHNRNGGACFTIMIG